MEVTIWILNSNAINFNFEPSTFVHLFILTLTQGHTPDIFPIIPHLQFQVASANAATAAALQAAWLAVKHLRLPRWHPPEKAPPPPPPLIGLLGAPLGAPPLPTAK